jgi:hypothetical protein
LLEATKRMLAGPMKSSYGNRPIDTTLAAQNLVAAHRAGVTLVTGTDSGNPLLVHGPAIHRELQLWVQAGVPQSIALQAATGRNSANLLGAGDRIGLIKKVTKRICFWSTAIPCRTSALPSRYRLWSSKARSFPAPASSEDQ